jgi:hypothetical protein
MDFETYAQSMSTFARRYSDAPEGLIEAIFLPVIAYFTERGDARWINLVWLLPEERSPISALTPAQTDIVLKNLLHLRGIESHAERVLALLTKNHPEKVFDFFGERLTYAALCEDEDRYEQVPYGFFGLGLETAFAGITDHAVDMVRTWFVSGDPMFQFRGGRLLVSSFRIFRRPSAGSSCPTFIPATAMTSNS